jgi:tRNA nucleotidyltransferase (CCA-adding enzyme)
MGDLCINGNYFIAHEDIVKIYLVGGAVRDQLLGRKVTERDFVVVGATPIDMLELGFQPVGKDFPVFLHPQTKEEYALARTERKVAKGYAGFECFADPTVTLEQDLLRRDLTINAMAMEWDDTAKTKNIIDPYGGQRDLQAKILRHVSPAFAEDPVRILRVARFAARFPNFSMHPETDQLMQDIVEAGEVDALVHERVWKEFSRALIEADPLRFFKVLSDCDALPILFPEFAEHPICFDYLQESLKSQHRNQINFSASSRGKTATKEAPGPFKRHLEHKVENYPLDTSDDLLRFGALTLALNKIAITTLCKRLHTPTRFSETALLVAKNIEAYQTLQALKGDNSTVIINFLEHIDAYRRPHRLFDFCHIANIKSPNEQAMNTLYNAFKATKEIDANTFIEQGLRGEEIGKAIHQARIEKLK